MAEARWIKIVTDIFDDEKILLIESLPEPDSVIVIWFKLLCLAGKNNNSGVFMLNGTIPYSDEMFSTIFRRNINTVRLALKTFESFGMIEIINEAVTIPNWSKHQNFDQIEKKNEYQKNYMKQYREKQKQIACNTNGNTNGNIDNIINSRSNSKANVSETEENRRYKEEKKREIKHLPDKSCDIDLFFEECWELYPNKKGKGSIKPARKKELFKLSEEFKRAIGRYVDEIASKHIEPQYIKHGSTFFNNGYVDYLDGNYQADVRSQKQAVEYFSKAPSGYRDLQAEMLKEMNGGD